MSTKLRKFLQNVWGLVVGTAVLVVVMAALSVLTDGAVPCVWPIQC